MCQSQSEKTRHRKRYISDDLPVAFLIFFFTFLHCIYTRRFAFLLHSGIIHFLHTSSRTYFFFSTSVLLHRLTTDFFFSSYATLHCIDRARV